MVAAKPKRSSFSKKTTTTVNAATAAANSSSSSDEPIVVLDNGGDCIKIGFAGEPSPRHLVPNCSCKPKGEKRAYVGLETVNIADINGMSVRRPIEKGYLVNPSLQKDIWQHAFETLGIDCTKAHLVVTEPPFNFPSARFELDKLCFEEFRFKSVAVVSTAICAFKAHVWQTRMDNLEEEDDAVYADDGDPMDAELTVSTEERVVKFDNGNEEKIATKNAQKKRARQALAGCVLDVGFSFAHASPIFDGKIIDHFVKRLNLGGRALTNYLKELVSYRQWNVMEEFALIEDAKLKSVYCVENGDVYEELREAKKKIKENKIAVKYVLPDGVHTLRGFLAENVLEKEKESSSESEVNEDDDFQTRRRKLKKLKQKNEKGAGSMELAPDAQSLVLVNERFMVPEILFHPNDIGLNQCGIVELVAQAVHHEEARESIQDLAVEGLVWLNIVVCGGCAKIPGLVERVRREIRAFCPSMFHVDVRTLDDPISDVWLGASLLASNVLCFDEKEKEKEKKEHQKTFLQKYATSRDAYLAGGKKSARKDAYKSFVASLEECGRVSRVQ